MSRVAGAGRDAPAVDFPFLQRQCFDDAALQRELLHLFLEQTERPVAGLRDGSRRAQDEAAHRLKGSCCGIGAWAAAEAAQDLIDAAPPERAGAAARLAAALAEARTAIRTRLAAP